MEQRSNQSISLSQQFLRNLIIQQQQPLSSYQIHPSIIRHKYCLKQLNDIKQYPILQELVKHIDGVKNILDNFQFALNNHARTIYKSRWSDKADLMMNQTILSKFTSILQEYKDKVLKKICILPIYLTKQHNFQQQIKYRSKIIYLQQKQKAIIWEQQVKQEEEQGNIADIDTPKQSWRVTRDTYHKLVKINFDRKEVKLGQLNKGTSQFQGMIAVKKGQQFILSIGRWKGEQPIQTITINYLPAELSQWPFLIYRKYEMKSLAQSIVWFIQNNTIKQYHEKGETSEAINNHIDH